VTEKRVFITGCSGFLGENLLEKLSQCTPSLRIVGSYCCHRPKIDRPNITLVKVDLIKTDILAFLLQNVHTVIHLAWQASDGKQDRSFANVIMVKKLLAAMETSKVRRIIFLSSLGVDYENQQIFLQEKYRCESALVNQLGIHCVIIRSPVIYNFSHKSDRFFRSICSLLRFPGICPLPKGSQNLYMIYIMDMIDIITRVLESDFLDSAYVLDLHTWVQKISIIDLVKALLLKTKQSNRLVITGWLGEFLTKFIESKRHRLRLADYLNYVERQDQISFSQDVVFLPKKRTDVFAVLPKAMRC